MELNITNQNVDCCRVLMSMLMHNDIAVLSCLNHFRALITGVPSLIIVLGCIFIVFLCLNHTTLIIETLEAGHNVCGEETLHTLYMPLSQLSCVHIRCI